MAESILKIHTQNGDVPVGYPGLADKPIADKTLSKEGAFADSKAVGDRFKEAKTETDSLKEDLNEKSKTVVAKGFNMIEVCETGIGAYYVSGGDIKFNPSYTNYAYIIANVKKNTRYI